jgi:hypothetical protein
MRLRLINPSNPLVSIDQLEKSRWNRYRVWRPLSLMVLGGLTPREWEVTLLDENVAIPHGPGMPLPDVVVDDNLIGTRSEHIARAKDLFRSHTTRG